jgi:2-keto-4-pentenoate hydratase/2-oxohepta-3-ene-1,7-dioic acid hydratase in catechol pathway
VHLARESGVAYIAAGHHASERYGVLALARTSRPNVLVLTVNLSISTTLSEAPLRSNAMNYVFPPPPQVSVPVVGGSAFFPVRRIYCVGRNYAEHAAEMGAPTRREPPFFFGKPADALVPGGGDVALSSRDRAICSTKSSWSSR